MFMLAIAWLLTQAVSDQAWVDAPPSISPQQAQQVKALAKRTLRSVNQSTTPGPASTDRNSKVEVSRGELDALAAMLARAYPRLHSQFELTPHGVILTSSLRLPDNPFGSYLSVRLRLPISPQELRIDRFQLGQLDIPEPLLQRLIPSTIQLLFGAEQGHILLHTARLSTITTKQLTLRIDPPHNANQRLVQLLDRVRSFSGDSSGINRLLISQYYTQLQQQAVLLESRQWVSMTYFVAPLLRRIGQQVEPDQIHLHSQAAIMALALYLGSNRFEQIIGPVLSAEQRQQRPHHRTLLRGRVDLRQHFTVSAALQVLADAGFSQAIGEFKELLDSGKGGSGFSFADLAADRAGTLFAQRISRDPQQTMALIKRLDRPLREPDLMIPIDQLPEGLTQKQFQQHYRDLDSENYQQIINRIDTELNSLRLYSDLSRS